MNKKNLAQKEKKENYIFGTLMIAILMAGIVFAVLLNIEKNALQAYEKGTAVVARKEVPSGLIIDESNVSLYFQNREFEKAVIPASAFADMTELIGLITVSKLDTGSFITQGNCEALTDETINAHQLVKASISVSDISQAVSGTLRAGDRISLYNHLSLQNADTGEMLGNTGYETKKEWQNLFLFEAFDVNGVKIESGDTNSVAQMFTVLIAKEDAAAFFDDLSSSLQIVKLPNPAE